MPDLPAFQWDIQCSLFHLRRSAEITAGGRKKGKLLAKHPCFSLLSISALLFCLFACFSWSGQRNWIKSFRRRRKEKWEEKVKEGVEAVEAEEWLWWNEGEEGRLREQYREKDQELRNTLAEKIKRGWEKESASSISSCFLCSGCTHKWGHTTE